MTRLETARCRRPTGRCDRIRTAIDTDGPGSIGVLGGALLTNEAAYAWTKLAKGVRGAPTTSTPKPGRRPACRPDARPAGSDDR